MNDDRELVKPEAADLLAFCRLFGMSERDAVCGGDVSVSQCVALQLLLAGETDSSSLAESTGVTKGAITRLVEGLDKRGWITKKPDELDGRRTILSLSRSGKKKARELEQLTEVAIELLLGAVPSAKRKQVVESLRLLRVAAESVRDRLVC